MYEVIVSWDNFTDELDEWYAANKDRIKWTMRSEKRQAQFWFDDPNEAMMFKLRFGGVV